MVGITTAVQWFVLALAFGSTVVGGYVGYQAYRGYRRHHSRTMQYLSVGLFLLTAVAFTTAFVGSLLLRQGILPESLQQSLTLLTRTFQFVGVLFIAYSLHRRG